MRMSGCPCLTRRRFRRDPTDALFADQSQSILDSLMELLGRAERSQWGNRGCAVGGRIERLRALSREVIDPKTKSTRPDKEYPATALVEFRSVIDAMRCAVAVQQGATEQ